MKFMKLLITVGLLASLSSLSARVARMQDVRQRNLAPHVEAMVKDAQANGTYKELPEVVRNCWEHMEQGNYECNWDEIKQLFDATCKYLSDKYHVHVGF